MNLLYGLRDVTDIYIFDTNESLLVEMKCNKETGLYFKSKDKYQRLYVKDALLNYDILKLFGTEENKNNKTDYKSYLSRNDYNTISFGSKGNIECKLICVGYLRNAESGNNHKFKIEIPNARMINELNIFANNEDPSDFDYWFDIYSYNEKGDYFKLHIDK